MISTPKHKFGFRKTCVGLAGVCLGITFLTQANTVHADEVNEGGQSQNALVSQSDAQTEKTAQGNSQTEISDAPIANNIESTNLSENQNSSTSHNVVSQSGLTDETDADLPSYATNDANDLESQLQTLIKRRYIDVIDPITGKKNRTVQKLTWERDVHDYDASTVRAYDYPYAYTLTDEYYGQIILLSEWADTYDHALEELTAKTKEEAQKYLIQSFPEFITPEIEGYIPSQDKVEGKAINPYEYQDETITITYTPAKQHETGDPLTREELPKANYGTPGEPLTQEELPKANYGTPGEPLVQEELPKANYGKPGEPLVQEELPKANYGTPGEPLVQEELPKANYGTPGEPLVKEELPKANYGTPGEPLVQEELPKANYGTP
ncbi:hypothetical protein, partial [uncultured Lactobacillus sp.]